jgi:hypothetical protein
MYTYIAQVPGSVGNKGALWACWSLAGSSPRRRVTSVNALSIAFALYFGQRTIPILRCEIQRGLPKMVLLIRSYSSKQSLTVMRNLLSMIAIRLDWLTLDQRFSLENLPSRTRSANVVEIVARQESLRIQFFDIIVLTLLVSEMGNIFWKVFRKEAVKSSLRQLCTLFPFLVTDGIHQLFQDQQCPISAYATAIFVDVNGSKQEEVHGFLLTQT